jgi:hypothetical protein
VGGKLQAMSIMSWHTGALKLYATCVFHKLGSEAQKPVCVAVQLMNGSALYARALRPQEGSSDRRQECGGGALVLGEAG